MSKASDNYLKRYASLMENPSWDILKKEVYHWDGSLIDIYVQNTTQEDWKNWIDLANKNFTLQWFDGTDQNGKNQINFNHIKKSWEGIEGFESSLAVIKFKNIEITAHFFVDCEIENDIDPRIFKSIEDHQSLIEYLLIISNHLKKEVIVTPENWKKRRLITVKNGEVEINAAQ